MPMRSDKHAASHCPTSAMGGLYINKSPVSGRWGGVRSSTRTEIPAKGVEANNPEAERSARGGGGGCGGGEYPISGNQWIIRFSRYAERAGRSFCRAIFIAGSFPG